MKVNLSARWKPGHIERRDTEVGVYESINSPMLNDTEAKVQEAFLRYPSYNSVLDLPWKWMPRNEAR